MGKFMYQGMEYGERYIKKHMRYSATVAIWISNRVRIPSSSFF